MILNVFGMLNAALFCVAAFCFGGRLALGFACVVVLIINILISRRILGGSR